MRDIDFRAWDKITKRMMLVVSISFKRNRELLQYLLNGGDPNDYNLARRDAEDAILLQYTGLKDKNGRKVYEGDIVHYCSEDIDVVSEIGFDESLLAYVMYSWEGNYIFGYEPSSVFEVIGNIYENPELVEDLKK